MIRRRGWRGPDYEGELPSLGWSLLEWAADFLPSPRDPDEPLIVTDEQARLLVDWWTIEPVTERFVYRRGILRRSKGWGKSPLVAIADIAELAGEVVFDGWDAQGEPVGRPWGTAGDPNAWVQVAAVSEDQTDNTWSVIYDLLTMNEGRAADLLQIDAGLTRCRLQAGKRRGLLEPVSSSAGTREGQPITAASLDETHLWLVRNGGVKLARTIRRNVAKMGGRSMETTNAFRPGEESVAERSQRAYENGSPGILYNAVEADPIDIDTATDAELEAALRKPYGDAWWVDLSRLVQEARDPDVPREDVERYSFNWNVAGGSRAVDPKRWDELVDAGRAVADGERVGLGFDGSISHDATALIGCTADGHLFVPEVAGEPTVWVRPVNAPRGWKIPRLAVEGAVAELMERFDVGRMFCDPPRWYTEIERWAELYGDDVVLMLDTNQPKRFSAACDRWDTALGKAGDPERHLTHDGNSLLRQHVLAMVRRKAYVKREDEDDGRTRYVFDKGPDGHLIDAGIASVNAHEAAATMPAAPPKTPPAMIW